MSSAFWEIENALILRSHFVVDRNEDGSARYTNINSIAAESFVAGETLQLAQSVARLAVTLGLEEEVPLDSEVGGLLSTLDPVVNIPVVAAFTKFIFDTVSSLESEVSPVITSENDAFSFALAAAVATESIIRVAAATKETEPNALADALLETFRVIPPPPPVFEFHEDRFSPSAELYNVERIIRLNSEFEDHNIEALRHKSFAGTQENNAPFGDMARSLAAFVWAINRTIDLHKDETFVYDFSRLGTEHIERISRSWGIKEIDTLLETVEAIMKGIGTVYETDEKRYHYAVPNTMGHDYERFRYIFNVAMASVSSAHVFLFASNFDSTQEGVYGEVRRTIKEVQDERTESAR